MRQVNSFSLLLCLFATLGTPGRSLAQEPAPEAKGRFHSVDLCRAYFQRHLRCIHEKIPPKLRGRAERELNRRVAAAERMARTKADWRRFLQVGCKMALKFYERRLARYKCEWGHAKPAEHANVHLISVPSRAVVVINGKVVGRTPYTGKVPAGNIRFLLRSRCNPRIRSSCKYNVAFNMHLGANETKTYRVDLRAKSVTEGKRDSANIGKCARACEKLLGRGFTCNTPAEEHQCAWIGPRSACGCYEEGFFVRGRHVRLMCDRGVRKLKGCGSFETTGKS